MLIWAKPSDVTTYRYVYSEVQWMKCNPRNTWDIPSPTVDLLLVKGHVPSHHLLMSHLLTVELELHLPVTVKPWKSTEKLQVFQEDCVPSQIDLNRPSPVEQNRYQIWETRSCHPQHLPAPRCWSVHAVTLSRVRSYITLLSQCLRSLSRLCTSLSHSCHCLVIAFLVFCTWRDFFAFYCY